MILSWDLSERSHFSQNVFRAQHHEMLVAQNNQGRDTSRQKTFLPPENFDFARAMRSFRASDINKTFSTATCTLSLELLMCPSSLISSSRILGVTPSDINCWSLVCISASFLLAFSSATVALCRSLFAVFCCPAVLFVVMSCLFRRFLFSHPSSVKDSLVMKCLCFFLLFLVPFPFLPFVFISFGLDELLGATAKGSQTCSMHIDHMFICDPSSLRHEFLQFDCGILERCEVQRHEEAVPGWFNFRS
jgi:hypothetical protein